MPGLPGLRRTGRKRRGRRRTGAAASTALTCAAGLPDAAAAEPPAEAEERTRAEHFTMQPARQGIEKQNQDLA